MGIGWLTLLKTVPWSEVISNAPRLAEGGKKLWNTVARKAAAGEPSAATAARTPAPGGDGRGLAAVEARTVALEAAVAELHQQMLASSELINALADQNAQLVKRVEANRRRLLWLSAASAVLAILLLVALVRIAA